MAGCPKTSWKNSSTYFNRSLNMVCFPRFPQLQIFDLTRPTESIQAFLDIFVLAERVIARRPDMFHKLVRYLMDGVGGALGRFSVLCRVDCPYCEPISFVIYESNVYGRGSFRLRL